LEKPLDNVSEEICEELVPEKYYVMGKSGEKKYLPTVPVTRNTVRTMTIDNLPPYTLAEAMLLPGTQQWEATEGCYLVQTMDSLQNPPTFTNTTGSVYTADELQWPNSKIAPDTGSNGLVYCTVPTVDAGLNQSCTINNFKTPFNKKGCVLSGLTPQSTFKVNRTVILERFISSQDANLSTLAKMSASKDDVAMKLYSEIIRCIPIGAKFRDNGLGDWFLGVVDSIVDTVSSIGRPLMGAISGYQAVRSGGSPTQNGNEIQKVVVRQAKPLPPTPKKRVRSKKVSKPLPPTPVKRIVHKPLPPTPKKKT